ncbi:MAG: DEAD/DEAH box helicase [Anaerolineae bacterium]|nr:DEAD/DEAH box helicase [Anaerolineae bacterium]
MATTENPTQAKVSQLLAQWQSDRTLYPNIVYWKQSDPVAAELCPFPEEMDNLLAQGLRNRGIRNLYSHQRESWNAVHEGQDLVVVSGTASGKSYCYLLPILHRLVHSSEEKALLMFPTKALSADQFDEAREWGAFINRSVPGQIRPAMYDGDTPSSQRPAIRANANLLFTNPDMLHLGILPHHTQWEDFFRGLSIVVIDEVHVYRGVFGSHVANVIRRLRRVARFYGRELQFILTSATVANPLQHGSRLIDNPSIRLVDRDGAPRGERNFLFYNPPVINEDLGVRASASGEAMRITSDLFRNRIQTILFSRTRRGVEIILRHLKDRHGDTLGEFRAYRSGYLPEDRRDTERNLRNGTTRVVVATSALELGIDIGGLDAAVLVGYPGTISATLQQSGRAGRGMEPSCAVMVASANPLDQYLVQHPDYFFGRNPENVLIDPDNLLILLNHIKCAMFELPFRKGEQMGSLNQSLLSALLDLLVQSGMVHEGVDQYFWMDADYPASHISLRSSAESTILLQTQNEGKPVTIGEVDELSSYWMTHPDAVYLHGGESYLVENLDFEKKVATLTPFWGDYYTDPVKDIKIERISVLREKEAGQVKISQGEIMVHTQVVGFRRMRWETREIIDTHDLLMPVNTLRTTAYWFQIPTDVIDVLRSDALWRNDPNQYGPAWNAIRTLVKRRDQFRCQLCGVPEGGEISLHVHHKIPFRAFSNAMEANRLDNLVSLCPACHQEAEKNVKIRSGLAGVQYAIHHLSPLTLMCDMADLEAAHDAKASWAAQNASVILYELIPAGIGYAEKLFDTHDELLNDAYDLVSQCPCKEGCPSCVGPAGENGLGGKAESLALMRLLSNVDGRNDLER